MEREGKMTTRHESANCGDKIDQSSTNGGGVLASYRFFSMYIMTSKRTMAKHKNFLSASGPLGVKTNSLEVSRGHNVRRTQSYPPSLFARCDRGSGCR